MESLVTALIVVSSMLLGCIGVGAYALAQLLKQWDAKIRAHSALSDQYREHLTKAAESNNSLIAKVVELTDKVSTHEMMLKGRR